MIVFLDTVGLLALWDMSDQWHSLASAAFGRIVTERASLITTRYILLEAGNAAARRPYRSEVNRLRRALEAIDSVIEPIRDDWQTAWHAFDRGEAGGAGIVDQISFTVMRRLEIHEAFTNDQHFAAAGFVTSF